MLPCYVMLDLETTGGNAVHDRITEIAAVRVEDGVEVERWSASASRVVYRQNAIYTQWRGNNWKIIKLLFK